MSRHKLNTVYIHEISQKIARTLKMSTPTVRAVLSALGVVVTNELAKGRTVLLQDLGQLSTCRVRSYNVVNRKVVTEHSIRVSFKKSPYMKEILKMLNKQDDQGMDKYAVDETAHRSQAELDKLAAHGCPVCGKHIIKQGSVLLCPTHGSEPFE